MRLVFFLALSLLFLSACKITKPSIFVGSYTFADGDDFITAPNGCIFTIDSSLNFSFCLAATTFLDPRHSIETMRQQFEILLESDPNTRGKYPNIEAFFADPEAIAETKTKLKEGGGILQGKMVANLYEVTLPKTTPLELQPKIIRIAYEKGQYILRIEFSIKELRHFTCTMERKLKKLK